MKEPMIPVILVEDHKIVLNGLRALIELEDDMNIVDQAEDGIQAIKLARKYRSAVVIMDVALPLLNGLEASRQILKSNPEMKILVLSAHADDGYIEKAMEIGVGGYLVKQCSPNLLLQAIRLVHSGKKIFSPIVLERLTLLDLDHQNGKFQNPKKKKTNLSARESEVLQLIAEGKANKQIAGILEISIKTVEKHRQNLMKKLSIHDTAGLTRYAIAEGFIENRSQKTTH